MTYYFYIFRVFQPYGGVSIIKELKIVIKKNQVVSIHTKDSAVIMGPPEKTSLNPKIKLMNKTGVTHIYSGFSSYDEIAFP